MLLLLLPLTDKNINNVKLNGLITQSVRRNREQIRSSIRRSLIDNDLLLRACVLPSNLMQSAHSSFSRHCIVFSIPCTLTSTRASRCSSAPTPTTTARCSPRCSRASHSRPTPATRGERPIRTTARSTTATHRTTACPIVSKRKRTDGTIAFRTGCSTKRNVRVDVRPRTTITTTTTLFRASSRRAAIKPCGSYIENGSLPTVTNQPIATVSLRAAKMDW